MTFKDTVSQYHIVEVVLDTIIDKKLSFMSQKKLPFIYFLLPKKIPEFNFILSAGFTFAGVWTQRETQNCKISVFAHQQIIEVQSTGLSGRGKNNSGNRLRIEFASLVHFLKLK